MRRVALFLWLNLRSIWNSFRGNRLLFVLLLVPLALFFQVGFGLGIGAFLIGLAMGLEDASYPEVVLPVQLVGFSVTWCLSATISGGYDDYLAYGRLLPYPISFRDIGRIRIGVHVLGPRTLMFLPPAAVIVVWSWFHGVRSGLLGTVALLLTAAWSVLMGLALRNTLIQVFRRIFRRRFMEVLLQVGVLLVCYGIVITFFQADSLTLDSLRDRLDVAPEEILAAVPGYLVYLPPAWSALGLEGLLAGSYRQAALMLAGLFVSGRLLARLARWGLVDEYRGHALSRAEETARPLRPSLFARAVVGVHLPGGFQGLVLKEILTMLRNWKLLLGMLGALASLFVILPVAKAFEGTELFAYLQGLFQRQGHLLLGFSVPLLASGYQSNLFGFEGPSVDTFRLLPVRPRMILVAKNVAVCLFTGVVYLAFYGLLYALFQPPLGNLFPGLAMFIASASLAATLENFVALLYPFPFERPPNMGNILKANLVTSLYFPITGTLAFGGTQLTAWFSGPDASRTYLYGLALFGLATYGVMLSFAEQLLEERWEQLREQVAA